jgi:hypothetical protein
MGAALERGCGRLSESLSELAGTLAADYRSVAALPPPRAAAELSQILETEIGPMLNASRGWQSAPGPHRIGTGAGAQQIIVEGHRYGALTLWGFSCEAPVDGGRGFLIFLNTAHEAGAVAATMGHEIGHLIHARIGRPMPHNVMRMGGLFAAHLGDEAELYADCAAALLACGGTGNGVHISGRVSDDRDAMADGMRMALGSIRPHYRVNLARRGLSMAWRVRYLTLMIHLAKLRRALAETASI